MTTPIRNPSYHENTNPFQRIARPEQERTQTRLATGLTLDSEAIQPGVSVKFERLTLDSNFRPFFSVGSSFHLVNISSTNANPKNAGFQIQTGPGVAYSLLNKDDTYVQVIAGIDLFVRPLELSGGGTPYSGLMVFGEEMNGLGIYLKLICPKLERVGATFGLEIPSPF